MSSEPLANAQAEKFNDEDLRESMEWSRHYDELLWLVTSLLIGANAALLAITCDKDKTSIRVCVLGIAISLLTVFFAASFRKIRRRLRARLEKQYGTRYDWLVGGSKGWLKQWRVYVSFFAGFAALWLSFLWTKSSELRCGWFAALVLVEGPFYFLYRAGR